LDSVGVVTTEQYIGADGEELKGEGAGEIKLSRSRRSHNGAGAEGATTEPYSMRSREDKEEKYLLYRAAGSRSMSNRNGPGGVSTESERYRS
jgi:hypothetical protein